MGANSKFKITTEIKALLLENPKIKALVNERVFPLIAVGIPDGDFILYRRDAYSKIRTKMGVYEQKCMVYVNAISNIYDRSQELAELINSTLEGNFENPNLKIQLEDSTEEFEDGKYIQILLFSIE